MNITVSPKKNLRFETDIPADKSISHRAVMLGAIAKGDTRIKNFLTGEDCVSTVNCLRAMGVSAELNGAEATVRGRGLRGLRAPSAPLDAGNSGTAMRLILGILAGQGFTSRVIGDESLSRRPMNRVITPLSQMGAQIEASRGRAPLTVTGGPLRGIDYDMPIASAQVKSAILLASLYAEGPTVVRESPESRNHTEIMLKLFGADVSSENGIITSRPVPELRAADITVPGDISSAAFFIVLGLCSENSEITIRNVGVNPTRAGLLDALRAMGADITLSNRRGEGEPTADITARSSRLRGAIIRGSLIPRMIDEIPVFAVCAALAEGRTVIRDAEELKVKESDRVRTTAEMLRAFGANAEETGDGLIIEGGEHLRGGRVDSKGDHRIAMSAAVAGVCARSGDTVIEGAECAGISFPGFFEYPVFN
ncbi:MAG: 3-phosphoshikimate 1-carboxyvinyltransferase [Clostridiales bacterium]|jgi:3-phosphoshikimate 1-carboxyvinyltransferase|nr:3-phosphoshikimate 1-carboxyvinyltransferase [Clostridiales bacterium]